MGWMDGMWSLIALSLNSLFFQRQPICFSFLLFLMDEKLSNVYFVVPMGFGSWGTLDFFSFLRFLSPCTSYNSIQKTHRENKDASEQAFIIACTTTPQHGPKKRAQLVVSLHTHVKWDMVRRIGPLGNGWAWVPSNPIPKIKKNWGPLRLHTSIAWVKKWQPTDMPATANE